MGVSERYMLRFMYKPLARRSLQCSFISSIDSHSRPHSPLTLSNVLDSDRYLPLYPDDALCNRAARIDLRPPASCRRHLQTDSVYKTHTHETLDRNTANCAFSLTQLVNTTCFISSLVTRNQVRLPTPLLNQEYYCSSLLFSPCYSRHLSLLSLRSGFSEASSS
jgi:hypothetical protein